MADSKYMVTLVTLAGLMMIMFFLLYTYDKPRRDETFQQIIPMKNKNSILKEERQQIADAYSNHNLQNWSAQPSNDKQYKQGYLPDRTGYWFQNGSPSLDIERGYHDCIAEKCGGLYEDYDCRQMCYLRTMKGGSSDIKDYLCMGAPDEESYYACMDSLYGDYKYYYRETGTKRCTCPSGATGVWSQGACQCPADQNTNDGTPYIVRNGEYLSAPFGMSSY